MAILSYIYSIISLLLLFKYLTPPLRGWRASTQEGERRKDKREEERKGQMGKPPTPTRAIDAFIRDEERNGKQKKDRNREREPKPAGVTLTDSIQRH